MDPFTKIVSRKLRDELDDLMGRRGLGGGMEGSLSLLRGEAGSLLAQFYRPPVDVYVTDGGMLVLIDVPGYSREQLELVVPESTEIDLLRVRGQRTGEDGEVLEPLYGERSRAFDRRIPLPETCLSEGVEAHLEDGVLRVELRRVAGTTGRKVEIR